MRIEFGSVTSVIKAADVRIGPPVTIPAPPVIRLAPAPSVLGQAEVIASAAWTKAEPVVSGPAPLELASPAAFFESNMNIISIITRFNPQQLSPPKTASLTKEGAVAEAEHWLQQASYKQPEVLPPPITFVPSPAIKDTAVIEKIDIAGLSKRTPAQVATITQPNKEELITESAQDTKPAGIPQYSEASDEFRLISVEDEKTAGQRREEIKAAIKKAFLAVEKLGLGGIVGKLVAKFLPKEHEGIRSQIIKRYGPDGSLVDTFQAIASDQRKFENETAAEREFLPLVEENKPVRRAKRGKKVSLSDVARVLKYLVIKPRYAYEIFIKRTTKKKIPINQPSNEPVEVKTESNLEDYPQLQAVFNSGLTDSNSLS